MILRILAIGLLFFCAIFMPFWLTFLLALFFLFYFSYFIEGPIIFFLIDLIFGVEKAWHSVSFVSFFLALFLLLFIEFLKKKIRFFQND